jgi:hypothetical protein
MSRRRFAVIGDGGRVHVTFASFSDIRDLNGMHVCNSVTAMEEGRVLTFFKIERAYAVADYACRKYGQKFKVVEYSKEDGFRRI